MSTTRMPGTTLAAAAALLVIAGAAVTGCGQAPVSGAIPAGNSGNANGQGGQPGPGGQPGAGPGTATGSPGTMPPTTARLCADVAAVRTVAVTRIPGLGLAGPAKPVPSATPAVAVASRARSVALARAICALPEMPRGVLSCPVDVGGGFELVFATADLRFPPVTIRASGCEEVLGASQRPRWIPGTPGFWAAFSRLTGITAPAHRP